MCLLMKFFLNSLLIPGLIRFFKANAIEKTVVIMRIIIKAD